MPRPYTFCMGKVLVSTHIEDEGSVTAVTKSRRDRLDLVTAVSQKIFHILLCLQVYTEFVTETFLIEEICNTIKMDAILQE